MKKALFLCLLFLELLAKAKAAPDTTKVLFIGNSFTYVYDVPGLVKGFADQAGLPLRFAMHAPGGISVGDVNQGVRAHMMNPVVYDLIRSDDWDYVVLQDNQGRFVYGSGIFPSTSTSKVLEGHQKIRDSVVANNPCAKMLWFAGWAFKNGYPGIANTGEELIENIYENYKVLNQQTPEVIAPIGMAWVRAMHTLPPHVNLWGPDNAHQSEYGSYLTAAIIFTSIYKNNTESIDFNSTLDTAVTRVMRRIAYQTVMDSMTATRLSTITPGLQFAGITLTAPSGYTNYAWYKDTTLLASNSSNTFSISTAGTYQVIATNASGCTFRSKAIYAIPTTAVSAMPALEYYISPQPAINSLSIRPASGSPESLEISLSDLSGKVLLQQSARTTNVTLDVSALAEGLYLLKIQSSGQNYTYKMLKTGH